MDNAAPARIYPELAEKCVLITGAASGIGLATAELFARSGARVGMADIAFEAAQRAINSMEPDTASRCFPIAVDVADANSRLACIAEAAKAGAIDILANVAGVFPMEAFATTSDTLLHRVMEINCNGVFAMCRDALPYMPREGGGTIVNVASGAAFQVLPNLAAYSASKAALVAFSRTLALEAAPDVRVNVVAPGGVATNAVLEIVGGAGTSEAAAAARQAAARGIPAGRLGNPQEIASVIAFLASDRSSFISGETIQVNGGGLMR